VRERGACGHSLRDRRPMRKQTPCNAVVLPQRPLQQSLSTRIANVETQAPIRLVFDFIGVGLGEVIHDLVPLARRVG